MISTSFTRVSAGVSDPIQWSLLYYSFYAHRCAVRLDVKKGKCSLLPFVNTSFDNRIAWSDGIKPAQLLFRYGSKEIHYKKKREVFGISDADDEGYLNDLTKWWLNGHILCNVVPKNLWSTRGLDEMERMLAASLHFLENISGTFVLNKRDSPMMRRSMADSPFPSLGTKAMHPMFQRQTMCPLSFYVGPQWADIAIPLPEAWKWSTTEDSDGGGFLLHKCFKQNGMLSRDEFFEKIDKAIFRGTATGAGLNFDNQRLKLASLTYDWLDAGITAWNQRDRIIDGIVDFQIPLPLRLADRLSPRRQSSYKIIVYVDGHQASSRLIWHLASGSALFIVDSGPLCLAPKIWLHDFLKENVHYVRIAHDLSNLNEVKNSLNSDKLFELASNSYEMANKLLTQQSLARAAADAIISSARGRA
jgi:hypothetical protein